MQLKLVRGFRHVIKTANDSNTYGWSISRDLVPDSTATEGIWSGANDTMRRHFITLVLAAVGHLLKDQGAQLLFDSEREQDPEATSRLDCAIPCGSKRTCIVQVQDGVL